METLTIRIKRLLLQMFILIFFYSICRLLFVFTNSQEFSLNPFQNTLVLFLGGFRFDLSAIAITNSLFIAMVLLPATFTTNKHYRNITAILFIALNSICLLINFVDIAYFPFVHKRSQADTWLFLSGDKGSDLFRLLPSFLLQYWYLILTYSILIWILWRSFKYTLTPVKVTSTTLKSFFHSSIVFLLGIAFTVIMIRGGVQAKPLNIIHASEMTEVKNIPAIINTPFSIIKTIGKKTLPDVKHFSEEQMQELNNGIHLPTSMQTFEKKNIVIIIVESLSKKYLGYFGGKAQTPFLDSLFTESLVFTNGFANAKESIQGIPAIISSIPSWQDEPFIFSPYASNKITSLADILGKEGYETAFFHGGFNGTMGFDSYASLAGYSTYYGRNEYGNENDYDGNWGIWDEPFLQFMAQKLEERKPFFSTVLTLNPHHPFIIPDKYKNRFNKSNQSMLNSLSYVDYSLSRFFETIRNKPWFKNTLFVITADHTAPNTENEASSSMDDYRIPIVFYMPGNTSFKGTNPAIANQIDIMPSVLSLVNYPNAYYSKGKSLFAPGDKRCAITYNGGIYQYIDSAWCYQFNGQNAVGFYNWQSDSMLVNNLFNGELSNSMLLCDTALKKRIQFFNQSMINNKMNIETIRPGS